MSKWRMRVNDAGFDLHDNMRRLLDLRFADDVCLFARSGDEAAQVLEILVEELAKVGLNLNVTKTVVLTTEAQPPDFLITRAGLQVKRVTHHKWLGCILDMDGQRRDLDLHLQAAVRAFYANKWILQDKAVSVTNRLKFLRYVSKIVLHINDFRRIYMY